jgi:hypothetical protein
MNDCLKPTVESVRGPGALQTNPERLCYAGIDVAPDRIGRLNAGKNQRVRFRKLIYRDVRNISFEFGIQGANEGIGDNSIACVCGMNTVERKNPYS